MCVCVCVCTCVKSTYLIICICKYNSCYLYTELGNLSFTSAGDNEHWVYADGQVLGHLNNWQKTITVIIPEKTNVVAVMIKDYGTVGGLLGNFSDGSVTDSSWKCTRDYYDQWTMSTFDDSNWPNATASIGQGQGQGHTWGIQPKIANDAKWIWAGSYKTIGSLVTVYCRKKIG